MLRSWSPFGVRLNRLSGFRGVAFVPLTPLFSVGMALDIGKLNVRTE
jgi:hypothetical protein